VPSREIPAGLNFSCTVQLPDGSSAEVRQTDTHRGNEGDIFFLMTVHPQTKNSFHGVLLLADSSLTDLDDFAGETAAERAARVTNVAECVTNDFVAWVKKHDLEPNFAVEVTVVDKQSGWVVSIGAATEQTVAQLRRLRQIAANNVPLQRLLEFAEREMELPERNRGRIYIFPSGTVYRTSDFSLLMTL
jgi:hypothetical protein